MTENANLCGLKREDFQTTINGRKTDLYILRNRKGYEVAISNYGGAVCAIMVPDKNGNVSTMVSTICMVVLQDSTPAFGMPARWDRELLPCIALVAMVKRDSLVRLM